MSKSISCKLKEFDNEKSLMILSHHIFLQVLTLEKINNSGGRLSPGGPGEEPPIGISGPGLCPSPAYDCSVNLSKSCCHLKLSFHL